MGGDNLVFDGIDDFINVGNLDILSKAFALSAWVQSDDLESCGSRADCRIISKATGVNNQDHYWMLSTINVNGKTRLRFRLKTNGVTTNLIATAGDLINGEIFHASAVYDGKTMRLYKNGIDVGSIVKTADIDTNNTVEAWIGGNPFEATSRAWKGLISDVRIYQKALTSEQVILVKDSYYPSVEPKPEPKPGQVIEPKDAARFLIQSTFGPTSSSIRHLVGLKSYEKWIDEQINLSPSFHRPRIKTALFKPNGKPIGQSGRMDTWWDITVFNDDQLRQRVAFALSEIMVISDLPIQMNGPRDMVADYYDILVRHSLGDFRELLEDVTLSPAMSIYLSMLGNVKPDPTISRRADENYARELLQLFSIGLVELNTNGTQRLDSNGKPTSTFNQNDIENLARIFTGWAWNTNEFSRSNFTGIKHPELVNKPLIAFAEYHDQDEKSFLNVIFPAGQTAREDLDLALDTIFNHPNVGPFIGKQLIMRLDTSNPSPAYVARVAQTFNDNGEGVRGDLKVVIKAILLDKEARTSKASHFGKLKEPLIRLTHLWRAFNASPSSEGIDDHVKYQAFHYHKPERQLFQAPMRAPSVFNFFRPDFSPHGKIKSQKLVAPEFKISTESKLQYIDDTFIRFVTRGGFNEKDPVKFDLSKELALTLKIRETER